MQLKIKEKFTSIDTMRGIAILMVIFVHTAQRVTSGFLMGNLAKYGQMGVQMFFIASAFTLCYSIDEKPINKDTLLHFYTRRFFRIAPGYYFGILLYFCIDIISKYLLWKNEWNPSYSPANIAANIFFLNGLYPPANNNIVPGGWSIGTEMLFYLIFPVLFKIYHKLNEKHKASIFLIPLISLGLTSLFQYLLLSHNSQKSLYNNSFMYFNIINQLPVFCIGISMYFAYRNGFTKNMKAYAAVLFFLFFTCISGLLFYNIIHFSLSFTLVPFFSALSFVFVFILLQNSEKIHSKIVESIGVLSYSSYLLHFIFTLYLLIYIPKISGFAGALLVAFVYAAVVLLTYFASKILHKYVEQPGIMLGKRVYQLLGLNKAEKKVQSV